MKPFLKWAGGKRQLLPRILAIVPDAIDTYYEPFVGGGAVFFALAGRPHRFKRAILADANEELVTCYRAIKRSVESVIRELKKHRHGEKYYYRVREQDPRELAPAARAARTIYLNRTGYNGLYRVNKSGRFNVPFGRYKNPRICDEANLRAASAALSRADIVCQDFEATVRDATKGDFIYFDPPYVPLSRTSNFTAYAQRRFGPAEQARLARVLRELGNNGVRALLSNSDCDDTRQLYTGLGPDEIWVRRAINSDVSRRGPVPELLVRSFAF